MVLSNAERQTRWRINHPELAKKRVKEFMHNARIEGKISKNGIKYETSEFYRFKHNFKAGQAYAKSLYDSEANSQLQLDLSAQGIGITNSLTNSPYLEKRHDCTKACEFYGHSNTWVDTHAVVYKLFIQVGGDFGEKTQYAYWVFKRYLIVERKLDFPEAKPVFECVPCRFSKQFLHIDDMFVFQSKCPHQELPSWMIEADEKWKLYVAKHPEFS